MLDCSKLKDRIITIAPFPISLKCQLSVIEDLAQVSAYQVAAYVLEQVRRFVVRRDRDFTEAESR